MKAAFLIWIIAAWTIERFTTQSRGSSASLLLHQLYNNGFNSLSGLKAHYFHSKYKYRTYNCHYCHDLHILFVFKLEKILKGSLDSIPLPSSLVKIQIMGGEVCVRCKGKTLLGVVYKLLIRKSVSTSPSNVLPYYLK